MPPTFNSGLGSPAENPQADPQMGIPAHDRVNPADEIQIIHNIQSYATLEGISITEFQREYPSRRGSNSR